MILKFEQTAEDYKAFNFYYSWSSPGRKETRFTSAITPSLVFILLIFFSKGYQIEKYGLPEFLLLFFGVVLIFTMKYLVKWKSNANTESIIKSGKNTDLVGAREITFTEEKLIATTPFSHTEIIWNAFEKVGETKEHFFLFIAGNQAIVIPKRIFTPQKEMEVFRNFVNSKMPC